MTLHLKLCYNLKSDISGNRYSNIEESPCSHYSEMIVVFVLSEKISLGRINSNGEEKVLMGLEYL